MSFFPDQPVSVRLRLNELRGLEQFVAIASTYDANKRDDYNPDDFWLIVEQAITRHGIRQTSISDRLGISQGTISRWVGHRSHPHHKIAEMIVQWLITEIGFRAASLRAQLRSKVPSLEIPDWTGGSAPKTETRIEA